MRSLQIGRTRKATVTALAISEFVLNSSHFAGSDPATSTDILRAEITQMSRISVKLGQCQSSIFN